MKKALFAGTFDPPTLGHLDVLRRAKQLCDTLYVGLAYNSDKPNTLFTAEERLHLVKLITQDLPGVEVVAFKGLAIDFAKQNGIEVLLRGLRPSTNLAHECDMALANRQMSGLETLFITTDERYSHLSSTLIREIASSGQHLELFVPSAIVDIIYKKMESSRPNPIRTTRLNLVLAALAALECGGSSAALRGCEIIGRVFWLA